MANRVTELIQQLQWFMKHPRCVMLGHRWTGKKIYRDSLDNDRPYYMRGCRHCNAFTLEDVER